MKIICQIDPEDMRKVRSFYIRHKNNAFVKQRVKANLRKDKKPISEADHAHL